jgi:hypothetical protein
MGLPMIFMMRAEEEDGEEEDGATDDDGVDEEIGTKT